MAGWLAQKIRKPQLHCYRPQMSDPEADKIQETIAHPVVVINATGALVEQAGCEPEQVSAQAALELLATRPCLICHATYLVERLGAGTPVDGQLFEKARDQRHFDVCELFAFVAPAQMATPTPQGIARALNLRVKASPTQMLRDITSTLLEKLSQKYWPHPRETGEIANFLRRGFWPWAEPVLSALNRGGHALKLNDFIIGLNVWDRIEEWEDDGPRPPGSHKAVEAEQAGAYLGEILGPDAELRKAQFEYCKAATAAFQPRHEKSQNAIILAEAGTGLGKTLGYLAPSHLWARQNNAPVWLSTYTKNLQRQLEQETHRLIPDPVERAGRVVVRKGRENYVCLLNMQETFARMTAQNPKSALMAALVARWVRYSRDGDMVGGDFPAWLMSLFFPERARNGRTITPMALGLTDRRGECIFAACPHYKKCFIEKSVRAAKKADIVIANHALVMHQAAIDQALGPAPAQNDNEHEENTGLRRLVFDEGHHLFDAADTAFSAHITGMETAQLRRWIKGAENRARRGRSLADRLMELIDDDEEALAGLSKIEQAANCLPGPGWQNRIGAATAAGAAEQFLQAVREQVLARADQRGNHNLETDCRPLNDGLAETASELATGLSDLKKPMDQLATILLRKLDTKAGELDTSQRIRIEALARSLKRRSQLMLSGWIDMLARLVEQADSRFVEWFAVQLQFGHEFDFGMHSHWIDPSLPLATSVLIPADGVVITSATLKDRPPQAPDDWEHAEMRTGAIHLPYSVTRTSFKSPFDYASNAKIIVVNDMGRENMDHLAAAYRELFYASRGGALGLFTAISRLRAVHQRLATPLAQNGLSLFAQHVDPIDTGTLVDMFRAQENACLLGTDAVRDGVDVPGRALRLIVQDRVPWGQPSILERTRRKAFGAAAWQDMVVRLRLRQAFGRLIRRKDDRGVFVILDNRLASRFRTAFPDEVEIERMGLADAIDQVKQFTNQTE